MCFINYVNKKKHTITPNDQITHTHTTDDCMLPEAMLNRCVRSVYNFQRKEMEGRAGGNRGSELMQMGGAGSSRGITSKAFGAEEQTLCRSTNCWRPGVAAGMKK